MTRRASGCAAIATLVCWTFAPAAWAQVPDGRVLFERACASCHGAAGDSRAPALTTLQPRTPESIIDVLVTGAMRVQGSRLSGAERRAIAEFITGKTLAGNASGSTTGRCTTTTRLTDPSHGAHWSGW